MANSHPSPWRVQAQRALQAYLFGDAPSSNATQAWEEVEASLEWLSLPGGAVLFREGDPSDSLYILIRGRLRASVQTPNAERVLGEIGRGEFAGEMGVLTGDPRSATVCAIRDSALVKLPGPALDRLADKYPSILRQINRLLADRLRRVDERRRTNTLRTFAIVPLSADLQLADLSHDLAQSFGDYGATLLLDRRRVEDELGTDALQAHLENGANDAVDVWLDECESRYRFLLYQADAALSEWTRRCLRQADCILLVANPGADPTPGDLEQSTQTICTGRPMELALLHPASTAQPRNTHAWLAPRHVRSHHHLRQGRFADTQRLARYLTGHAVGLVLGGGGARGYAHVGVIRALEECGIPIDIVGGASIGSIIAAEYALGWDCRAMVERTHKHWNEFKPLSDVTLPFLSISSGTHIGRMFARVCGDRQIQDLWLPYFAVSNNLSRGQLVVHDRGPLSRAVRASSSLPGIWPPVTDPEGLLVDGGNLDNLPVDMMARLANGGSVIAVDINPTVDLSANLDYGERLTGW